MKSRRKAREAALQALFQCDALEEWSPACVERYFSHFVFTCEDGGLQLIEEAVTFARGIADGVVANIDFINSNITLAATHWSLSRMSRVDRNILRIAVYELAFLDDIPSSVTINEAIEVAKRYGSNDSPMFVNGVLDRVANIFNQHPEDIKRHHIA